MTRSIHLESYTTNVSGVAWNQQKSAIQTQLADWLACLVDIRRITSLTPKLVHANHGVHHVPVER